MSTDKLIEAKLRWAREGRLLVPPPAERSRLPPGQRQVRDWPVLDLGRQPDVSLRDWRLTAGGQAERKIDWGWADFQRREQQESVSDIHCVTQWSRFDNHWRGLPTRTLLEELKPLPSARFVRLVGSDSYTTVLPLEDFAAEGAILATHWEGQPLTRQHGGPVRLIVPHLYLWKSAKWLCHLWLTDSYAPGYWEARGYHELGDPWRQQRYG
jgi:DMSO/TMAO reductase YedYZ molybdopterin-dependent catalytic subunit